MIRFLLVLASCLFGYSQAECDICGWPYRTGVNSNGKCYLIREGLQGNLEGGCYVYCDAWARLSGVSTPSTPVLSFWQDAGGAVCKCQRLERSGEVSYYSRPTASCDWGYSDDVQHYYDSIQVNWRSSNIEKAVSEARATLPDTNFLQRYLAFEASLTGYGRSQYNGCQTVGGQHFIQYYTTDENGDNWQFHNLPLADGMTCANFYAGPYNLSNSVGSLAKALGSTDTALKRINDAIEAVQASIGSNNASIMDELGKIRSKPSGGGGVTDLTPVYDSLRDFNTFQSNQLRQMDSSLSVSIDELQSSFENSIDSLRKSISRIPGDTSGGNGTSLDLSGVEQRQDTTNARLASGFKGLSDSLSGVRSAIGNLDSSIGRLGGTLYRMDSAQRDKWESDRVAESLAYKKVRDSLGVNAQAEAEVRQGIQDAQGFAIQGESNASGLKTALQGWQNLPGTCSDAPTWDIDLRGSHLGIVTLNLNQYPWVPAFSRVAMRVMGIGAALLIVLKAMELLGYSNAKKD